MSSSSRTRALIIGLLLVVACGESPLATLGSRSSEWVTEPTVSTTSTVATTVALVRTAANLIWFNDDLGTSEGEPEQVISAVFARREGDRFIQASRSEIAIALPGILFPQNVPPLAEYVTSQLVIENSGEISADPAAAFGIWTAEPYTRSRSVGQMIVIRVFLDAETADEVSAGGADLSCSRFADASVDTCSVEQIGERLTWVLENPSGATLILFDGPYRYEVFGRPFAAVDALRQTAASMEPIAAIEPA